MKPKTKNIELRVTYHEGWTQAQYWREVAKGFAELAAEIVESKIQRILTNNSVFNEFINKLPDAEGSV